MTHINITPQGAVGLLKAAVGGAGAEYVISRYCDGRTHEEIAMRYGVDRSTVSGELKRARRKLRKAGVWPDQWDSMDKSAAKRRDIDALAAPDTVSLADVEDDDTDSAEW